MPKQSPIPDELDRAFYTAANDGRLVIQHCGGCDRYQHPPKVGCAECGAADRLSWREVVGQGTIYSYTVVYDTPVVCLQADQPFNVALIELDECPGISMLSHLPGTPPGEVPIGAPVRLIFEETPATGQKVPEWRVVDSGTGTSGS